MATALSVPLAIAVTEPVPAAPRAAGAARPDRPGARRRLAGPGARSWLGWLGRLGLLGLGGWLSLFRLSVPSWGLDEPTYTLAGRAYWHGNFTPNPEHPPLAKYLIGASQQLFGQTVTAARLPSALMLLVTGLVAWAWLARVGPPAAGPVAALLIWTLPVLATFPEALDRAPDTHVLTRTAMLDPIAAGLSIAALAAGWWWLRSGRLAAAGCCGLLSALACAAKFPAALIIVVPAVAGCLAAAARPGSVPARLGRLAAHAGTWTAAAAGGVVACYAPMGWPGAVDNARRGVAQQRRHGSGGHLILVSGRPRVHGPWWINLAWQHASWGTGLTVAAGAAVLLGLAARSGLTAYLAAAGLLPATLLAPLSGLALPHYLLLWRPVLIVAAVVGGTAGVHRLAGAARGRRAWRVAAVAVAVALAVPAAVSAGRSVASLATLRPTGYAALPALIPRGGTIWLAADGNAARVPLPGRRFVNRLPDRPDLTARPTAIVLDRGTTLRRGDGGLAAFARRHGYHLVRSGPLDIWLNPAPAE
ncbi:MAG: hypothetical protein V7637_599 [Mycobacteriales bacterium]